MQQKKTLETGEPAARSQKINRAKQRRNRLQKQRRGNANQSRTAVQKENSEMWPANQSNGHAPLYNQEEGVLPSEKNTKKNLKRKRNKRNERKLTKAALRRRNRARKMMTALFIGMTALIGVVLSVILLFRVTRIVVQSPQGELPADTGVYTEEAILAKLNIPIEENMFSFDLAEKQAYLQSEFPLLEDVTVTRKYPNTIVVEVAPAVKTYTIQVTDGWLVLSSEFRVMELVAEQPALLQISGAEPTSKAVGSVLSFVPQQSVSLASSQGQSEEMQAQAEEERLDAEQTAEQQMQLLEHLIAQLSQRGLLQQITHLVFVGEDGISFFYQNRIAVLIGTTNNLEYKLDLAHYILSNENGDGCASSDTGVLSIQYQSEDGSISPVFAQGVAQFPVKQS